MDAKLLKVILDDETLTDEQIAVLLVKAQKQAANQHFWADDDKIFVIWQFIHRFIN